MDDNNLENNDYADIVEAALEATSYLVPIKSKLKYEKCYSNFGEWRVLKKITNVDENVVLAFFFEKV